MNLHTEAPLFYCGDQLHEWKLNRIQQLMDQQSFDACLFLKHDAVRYVTEFYTKGYRPFMDFDYLAVVPKGKDPVIGYSLGGEEKRIHIRSKVQDARLLGGLHNWGKAIQEILSDYGLCRGRVGFDLLPSFIKEYLEQQLPKLTLVDMSDRWAELTATKHPLEIEQLKSALAIAQSGVEAAMDAIAPGVTEMEVAAAGEYRMRLAGSEMNPFIPVVASGSNAAIWERVATHRKMGHGEMVILDFGCIYNGYTGDFARTTVLGHPTSRQQALYTAAYEALQMAIEAVRPGVLCSEIDAIVREKVKAAGFEKYVQPWASGHQLGYGLHGAPTLSQGNHVPLQPGMVINIEPSLYTYDDLSVGGVEIEDTVLVTENGYERLTNFQYEPRLLR